MNTTETDADNGVRITETVSSTKLYHFKRHLGIVKLILQNGFQHRKWTEKLPFFDLTQDNFMVCFTDLKFEDSPTHQDCYGSLGIAMTKEWGRKAGISPVRYIHKCSPGMDDKYMSLKTLFRNAMKQKYFLQKMCTYISTSRMYRNGELPQGDVALLDKRILGMWQIHDGGKVHEFENASLYIQKAISEDTSGILCECLETLFFMINDLHSELEMRDAFTRCYIEDFTSPATGRVVEGKVLYDECEWRSIKHLTKEQSEMLHVREAIAGNYLPEEFNLKFNDSDVAAIIVDSEEQRSELNELICAGTTLLTEASLNKIYLNSEYVDHNIQVDRGEMVGNVHRFSVSS